VKRGRPDDPTLFCGTLRRCLIAFYTCLYTLRLHKYQHFGNRLYRFA